MARATGKPAESAGKASRPDRLKVKVVNYGDSEGGYSAV
jgi:hypothetical protein